MKTPAAAGVCLMLFLLLISAGCIGDQTTDINLGNRTVGKITLTPVYENMFSNSSLQDTFNVKVELFGMVFSKDGVTREEADTITSGILDSDGGLNTSFVNSSGLVTKDADDAGRNLTAFMDNVFHMPLTGKDKNQTINDIDWEGAFSRMLDSVNRTGSLLGLSDTE